MTPLPFQLPLIAILRGITPDEVDAHVDTLVGEGFDAIEIPTNSPGWQDSVRRTVQRHGRHACIGAGTVVQPAHVDALLRAGGRLMVAPDTEPELIRRAVAEGLLVAAGIATASEAFRALRAGAQLLKLFPASIHGPALVRALRSVLPPVPLFAVGGISPLTLASYLSAGCQGAGAGGDLYQPGQPVAATRDNARRFRQAYLDHSA